MTAYIDLKTVDGASLYQPIIEGQTNFPTKNGVSMISGITFTGSPGYSYNVILRSDGVDESKQSNLDFMQQHNASEINFNMTI